MGEKNDIYHLSKKIHCYSRNNSIAVVLRHSIREEIIDARISHEISLTNKGKKLAFEFGTLLPADRRILIFHSPVPRCKETGELILKGVKNNNAHGLIIGERNLLGCPFMLKPDLALGMVNSLGGPDFIKEWLNGRIDQTIMEPSFKARNEIIHSIVQCGEENNTTDINIHISHDWNVILLMTMLYDLKFETFHWPDYMEGVIIKFGNEQITIYFRDREKTFELNEL